MSVAALKLLVCYNLKRFRKIEEEHKQWRKHCFFIFIEIEYLLKKSSYVMIGSNNTIWIECFYRLSIYLDSNFSRIKEMSLPFHDLILQGFSGNIAWFLLFYQWILANQRLICISIYLYFYIFSKKYHKIHRNIYIWVFFSEFTGLPSATLLKYYKSH